MPAACCPAFCCCSSVLRGAAGCDLKPLLHVVRCFVLMIDTPWMRPFPFRAPLCFGPILFPSD